MSAPIYRHVVYSAQICDAAGMVVVAVGAQDRGQFELSGGKKCQYGSRIAGIDHDGGTVTMKYPDVVVGERGNRGNFVHGR